MVAIESGVKLINKVDELLARVRRGEKITVEMCHDDDEIKYIDERIERLETEIAELKNNSRYMRG